MSKVFELPVNQGSLYNKYGNFIMTNNGSTPIVVSKIGKVIMCNGTNQYLGHTIANFRNADSQGAIFARFKSDLTTDSQVLLSVSSESEDTNYLIIGTRDDGRFRFGQTLSGTDVLYTPVGSITPNIYHEVVIVSTGSENKIYINGIEQGLSIAAGSNTGVWFDSGSGLNNITIGVLKRTTIGFYFKGMIGDIKVINHVPTQTEIDNSYNEFLHSYNIEPPVRNFFENNNYLTANEGGNNSLSTGIVSTEDMKFEVVGRFTTTDSEQLIGTAGTTNGRFYFGISTGPLQWWIGYGSTSIKANGVDTELHTFTIDGKNNQFLIDGGIIVDFSAASFGTGSVLDLFKYSSVAARYPHFEMYSAKIWNDAGVLIKYYTPIENGMVDNLTGTTIINSNLTNVYLNVPSNVYLYETFAANGADGVNKLPLGWDAGTGTVAIKEDSTSNYMECTGDGTISIELGIANDYTGKGYVQSLNYYNGSSWSEVGGDTLDQIISDNAWLTYVNNKLVFTLTTGDRIRNIILTKS